MKVDSLIFRSRGDRTHAGPAAFIVAAWLAAVFALVARHVFWSDEVRALSLALSGDDVLAMLATVHGEGHPALWYLLLRGASVILPAPSVLAVVALLAAALSVVLLVVRSPFSRIFVVLFLLGRPALYEYAVMARNYGISMLLMFSFAALYRQQRERGIVLGCVLFLLANCNAHSALLAIAFCLFWWLDLAWSGGPSPPSAGKTFRRNAVIAGCGVAVCAMTIYPPFNDASQMRSSAPLVVTLLKALILPAGSFPDLVGLDAARTTLGSVLSWSMPYEFALRLAMSALLIGSLLGVASRPAAGVAAFAALSGLSVFFSLVYPGFYRHQALWLTFVISLYWIVGEGEAKAGRPAAGRLRAVGRALFCVLLLLQIPDGVRIAGIVVAGDTPESRSRDLAALLAHDPALRDAIVVADPDHLIEALPQYAPNRTYLLREGRFGKTVVFTNHARLVLGLDDILADARRLRETTGHSIVIVLAERLDPGAPGRVIHEGYNWTLTTTPEQVATFLSAVRRIARLGPVCCSDESYDVYVLER